MRCNGGPATPLLPRHARGADACGGGGFGDCFDANHRPYTFGCGTNVFATFTSTPSVLPPPAAPSISYTALAFVFGRGQLAASITLFESDFSVLVDGSAPPPPTLQEVPLASFQGEGTAFPADGAAAAGGGGTLCGVQRSPRGGSLRAGARTLN